MKRAMIIGSVIGVLLLSGCGSLKAGAAATTGPTTVEVVPSTVYELTLDGDGSTLWFAEFDGTRAVLHELDTKTSKDTPHPLGESQASGIGAHVRQAPDGAIWVSDDYALFRYDPKQQATTRIPLDEKVPGAFADALEPTNPLPGTWVSAFAFDSEGNVLLARNNVPYLQVLGVDGKPIGQRDLPKSYDGLSDLATDAGTLTGLAGHSHTGTLGITPIDVAKSTDGYEPPTGQLRAAFGGQLAVYFAGGGSVVTGEHGQTVWTHADGTNVQLPLPTRQLEISDPLGNVRTHAVVDEVSGAAQVGGDLWYFEQTNDGYALQHLG